MSSVRRARTVVRPRQIAMYLSKMLTPKSLADIGSKFGKKRSYHRYPCSKKSRRVNV